MILSNIVNEKYKYSEITSRIIGCAMTVHSKLGSGFPEVIYQRAMTIEMDKESLENKSEVTMPVFYDGIKIGARRVDSFVENKVLVEYKATSELNNNHLAQAINYLEAFNIEIGLLINFGAKSLEFNRVINSKIPKKQIN